MKTRARKPTKVTLGKNVRRLRLQMKMSQEELAERVALTQVSISQIETAKVSTTLDILDRFAKALASSPSDLVSEPPGKS